MTLDATLLFHLLGASYESKKIAAVYYPQRRLEGDDLLCRPIHQRMLVHMYADAEKSNNKSLHVQLRRLRHKKENDLDELLHRLSPFRWSFNVTYSLTALERRIGQYIPALHIPK
jgi:hypothetical protein